MSWTYVDTECPIYSVRTVWVIAQCPYNQSYSAIFPEQTIVSTSSVTCKSLKNSKYSLLMLKIILWEWEAVKVPHAMDTSWEQCVKFERCSHCNSDTSLPLQKNVFDHISAETVPVWGYLFPIYVPLCLKYKQMHTCTDIEQKLRSNIYLRIISSFYLLNEIQQHRHVYMQQRAGQQGPIRTLTAARKNVQRYN